MAITDDLLPDFKTFLEMGDDDSVDEELKAILAMSEDFIFSYYGIGINQRTINEKIKPLYGNIWYTTKGEILSLINVSINGEDVDNTILNEFYYERNKLYVPDDLYYQVTDNIMIEYEVGYLDKEEVPYGLKMGLFILGKKIWNDSRKDTDTYAQISTGVRESVKFVDSIPLMADNLLNSYRIFRL